MTLYQRLPINPPTNTSGQDYYAHRGIIYGMLNAFDVVPPPTGNAISDTASIQTTIDAAITSNKGRTVLLSPGTYVVNATINLRAVAGLHLIGNGATVIQSSVSPVIKMAHCRETVFEGFTVNPPAGGIGIQCLRDNAPNSISPTMNTFRNVLIEGGAYGIVFGGTGMVDANNDFNVLENVRANNYTITGFVLEGSQSYANQFRNCFAFGANGAASGVNTGSVGGHFHWYGGGMNNNIVDFRMGRHYQPYLIAGVVSENSDRFFERVNSSYGTLIVQGCRWAGNAINADNRAIITVGKIKLYLGYNSISDGGADTPTLLDFGANALNRIEMVGNTIYSNASDVFPNAEPTKLEENDKVTNEGAGTVVLLTT